MAAAGWAERHVFLWHWQCRVIGVANDYPGRQGQQAARNEVMNKETSPTLMYYREPA
jgi:hypothetical protein